MTPTDIERQRRIEAIFDSHYGAVAAYFIRRSETRHDADDAAAQVFAVAWTKLERLPAEPETRLWLYGVARRVLAEQQRAARRRRRLDARLVARSAGVDVASDPIADLDQALEVRRAWRSLSDGDRELLALVAWEGLKVAEVARVLAIPAPLVSARLSKARRRLAHRLQVVPAVTSTTTKEPRHA
jgi:RNA polymerase sigma-70 factor (ECF subfamily)